MISNLREHRAVDVMQIDTDARPAHASEVVVHDHASIVPVLEGEVVTWMNGIYTLSRGDLFLVPEGAPHYALKAESCRGLGMSLCTACLRGAWGAAFSDAFEVVHRGGSAVRHLSEDAFVELSRLFQSLQIELDGEQPERALAVEGLLSLIAVQVLRACTVRREMSLPAKTVLVSQALRYIADHAVEGISLQDVARAVGRAPTHLATVVKTETGRTVVNWITHARMAVVRQLLLNTDETIEAIAQRSGFNSTSHFHRTFRLAHHITPNARRQLHQLGPPPSGSSAGL